MTDKPTEPAEPSIYGERTQLYMSLTADEMSLFVSHVKIFHPAVFDKVAEAITKRRAKSEQTGGAS